MESEVAMNSTGLDKSLLSTKKEIIWRHSAVLEGLEKELESSQDSSEDGNFTNRLNS